MSCYVTPEQYEIAEGNGIPKRNVNNRVYQRAWSVERAITQPLVKDKLFKYWSDVALENGINRQLFWQRVRIQHWDYEKAATKEVMRK